MTNHKNGFKTALLLLAAPLALLNINAHAATATPNSVEINFLGSVQGATCSAVRVVGGDTVNLGAVATTLFTGKGVAAATQNVNIALSGCGFTGVTKITPQLIANASLTDPDAIANGRPDIGAAVELFDADGTTHLQPNRLGTPVTVTSGATSATITLQAKFVQETATTPTPGSYQATTIISLTYS